MYSFSTNYLCPPGLSPRLIQSSLSPVLLTSWNCVFQGYQWNAWVWHIAIPNFILLKLSIAFVTIDHYLILEKFHPALFFFKFLQLFPFNTFWFFFFFSFSRHSGHWFPNFNSSTNHVGLTIRELYVDLTSTDSLQSQVNSLEFSKEFSALKLLFVSHASQALFCPYSTNPTETVHILLWLSPHSRSGDCPNATSILELFIAFEVGSQTSTERTTWLYKSIYIYIDYIYSEMPQTRLMTVSSQHVSVLWTKWRMASCLGQIPVPPARITESSSVTSRTS